MSEDASTAQPSAGTGADPGSTPESAAAKIGELRADKAWMDAYMAGDKDKVSEFTQLHQRAHAQASSEAEANAELFPAPKSIHDYSISFSAEAGPIEEVMAIETGIRQALFDEGVPTVVVNVAKQIIERNGVLDEGALAESRARGLAELQRRHGAKGAAALLAEARGIFDRVAARSEEAAALIDATGAGNDPHLIETLVRIERARKPARK